MMQRRTLQEHQTILTVPKYQENSEVSLKATSQDISSSKLTNIPSISVLIKVT